jgi:hypothetical protein
MSGQNGGNPRLDRIEGIIEALANRQNLIEDEFSRLLKAQVVMADHMNKLAETQRQTAAAHDERMRDTDDRLNALIKIVDDLVRRQGGLT